MEGLILLCVGLAYLITPQDCTVIYDKSTRPKNRKTKKLHVEHDFRVERLSLYLAMTAFQSMIREWSKGYPEQYGKGVRNRFLHIGHQYVHHEPMLLINPRSVTLYALEASTSPLLHKHLNNSRDFSTHTHHLTHCPFNFSCLTVQAILSNSSSSFLCVLFNPVATLALGFRPAYITCL